MRGHRIQKRSAALRLGHRPQHFPLSLTLFSSIAPSFSLHDALCGSPARVPTATSTERGTGFLRRR